MIKSKEKHVERQLRETEQAVISFAIKSTNSP
jgi:hypothetical protein